LSVNKLSENKKDIQHYNVLTAHYNRLPYVHTANSLEYPCYLLYYVPT